MSQQIIALGTADNDGTGDKPKPAGQKINANFTELYGRANTLWPAVNFTGDSKSGEPRAGLMMLIARYPLQLLPGTDLGVGGSGTGNLTNGLTTTTRLAAMTAAVQADIAAGRCSDLVVTAGTNDMSGASGEFLNPDGVISNLRKLYNSFKAAGGRYFIVMGMDPRTGSNSAWVASFDKLASMWAEQVRDVIFIPTAYHLEDWDDSTGGPLGGTTQALGAVMDSAGLHCKSYGFYRKGLAIESTFRALYPARFLHIARRGELYVSGTGTTARKRASYLGVNSRTRALGGTNSTTGGTVTGTPPLGTTLSGALAGLSVTFTAVNSAPLKALYGDGFNDVSVVRMQISGTPSANGTMDLNMPLAVQALSGLQARMFAHLYLNPTGSDPVTGLARLAFADSFFVFGTGGYRHFAAGPQGGSSSGWLANDAIPKLADGMWALECGGSIASNVGVGSGGPTITIGFVNGVPVTGTIDIISMSLNEEGTLPAATA